MMQRRSRSLYLMLLTTVVLIAGCARMPVYVQPQDRKFIDRNSIEFPNGFELSIGYSDLTAPTAIAVVHDEGAFQGALLIAEGGVDGYRPRIYGYKRDGKFFEIYPEPRGIRLERVPVPLGLLKSGKEIYGPIGGMVVTQGRIYVTHRDKGRRGVVSAFEFDGTRTTIVADLPSQGDFSLTDIAVHPTTGRLYFGAGAATNSGVVGLDNWSWIKKYSKFCDLPAVTLKLLGYRFDTRNPGAGIFGGNDIAVTAPFSPFGASNQTRINKAPNDKPTSAIYSVSPAGGDLRVEAHGIRLPRGLAFNEYANLFFTNNGMELRGTRPVKDDPDALLKFLPNTWYGFPDFSADLFAISESRFQPPAQLMKAGYPEVSALIDHTGSALTSPTVFRDAVLFGVFPALSGAAKFDFAPSSGPFREFRGNAIVAMLGDRAPFATSGLPLREPVGYKLVRLDLDTRQARDFVRNTQSSPTARIERRRRPERLERPIDAKFGHDGKLFILDFGRMEVRGGRERVPAGTGKVFVLEPIESPSTAPSP